jgi:hypothetical protein
MNLTEKEHSQRQAEELFDEVVVKLADARRSKGRQAYFPLSREAGTGSYFEEPILRTMQPSDFEFPGGGTAEGLVDALAELWTRDGETSLAAMAPRLKEIAGALREEAEKGDGTVSILCYTMF